MGPQTDSYRTISIQKSATEAQHEFPEVVEPSRTKLKATSHQVVELSNGGVSKEEHIVVMLARIDEPSPF